MRGGAITVLGGLAHIIAPPLSNSPTTRYPRCTIVAAIDGAAPAVRSNYLRLVATQPEAFQLQTATVRLALATARGTEFTVDLISTVHVASPDYYEEMQAQLEGYDRVLLELLLDEASVTSEVDAAGNTVRRLNTDISAPPALQQLAGQYGLRTQVDALDCRRSNAVIADVSRRQLAVQESRLQLGQATRGSIGILPPVPRGLSALFAPLRSIFLGSRASGLRPLILLLPAPELLMLLDDWIGARVLIGPTSPGPHVALMLVCPGAHVALMLASPGACAIHAWQDLDEQRHPLSCICIRIRTWQGRGEQRRPLLSDRSRRRSAGSTWRRRAGSPLRRRSQAERRRRGARSPVR